MKHKIATKNPEMQFLSLTSLSDFHGSKIHQTACNAAFVGDFVGGIDIRDSKIEREFPRGILCNKKH